MQLGNFTGFKLVLLLGLYGDFHYEYVQLDLYFKRGTRLDMNDKKLCTKLAYMKSNNAIA